MLSENGGEEEWGQGSDAKIQMIVERWQGRSPRGSAGPGGGREDSDWGYDQVPSEGKSDIDKQDIGFDNGLDNGRSDRLDGSVDKWKGEGPARYLQSTKIQLVEECVLRWIPRGRMRPRC